MKKKRNKGFTLVELLVAMTILGLIMVLVVPNVLKMTDSNVRQGYVNDSKKFLNLAKYKISLNKDSKPNGNGNCSVYGLAYLDNGEFTNPPNGGCYDVNRSFVVVKYYKHEYVYYVRLVEAYKVDDDIKYSGIGLAEPVIENEIFKDKVNLEYPNSVTLFNYSTSTSFAIPGIISCESEKFYLKSNGFEYSNSVEGNDIGICALNS